MEPQLWLGVPSHTLLWFRKEALRKPERVCEAHTHASGTSIFSPYVPRTMSLAAEQRPPEAGARRSSSAADVCELERRAPASGARLSAARDIVRGTYGEKTEVPEACLWASKARSGLRSAYFPNPRLCLIRPGTSTEQHVFRRLGGPPQQLPADAAAGPGRVVCFNTGPGRNVCVCACVCGYVVVQFVDPNHIFLHARAVQQYTVGVKKTETFTHTHTHTCTHTCKHQESTR